MKISIKKLRIGLSISDYDNIGYEKHYQDLDELKRFSQSLARHLLAREHTLIYGGDLRDDGFTQFILDEAAVLRDRLQVENLFVENYLAWPLHTKKENIAWYANYFNLITPRYVDITEDVKNLIGDKKSFLPPCNPENKYIWSRCLTKMREESISSSDVRIFAGGKLKGYLGKCPGVLEEFIIAHNMKKPIFLVGGLGGLINLLCTSIKNKQLAEEFTEEWQITHNQEYEELQLIASSYNQQANYFEIKKIIENIDIEELANRVGLSINEYLRIMQTPFIDESIHLILKGLKIIKGENNEH